MGWRPMKVLDTLRCIMGHPLADQLVRRCGKHTMTRVDSDILDITLEGEVTRDEIHQLLAARSELTSGWPYFLIVCRLRAFERISMAASRELADAPDPRPQGIVFTDASFRARIVAGMVIRSASLFVRQRAVFHFSSSEEDAEAWLKEARRKLGGASDDVSSSVA